MKSFLFLVFLVLAAWANAEAFDPARPAFMVQVQDQTVPYRQFVLSVLPGTQVPIAVTRPLPDARYTLSASGGTVSVEAPNSWRWTAPTQPGVTRVQIEEADSASVTLHIFVKRPLAQVRQGKLNGYRIGNYPGKLLRGNPIYSRPDGLIEVTRDMVNIQVSPHFTLGQFLCKQQPDHWPKYVALREELLVKLELLLEEVNRRGFGTETFHVMSGYRTPWYNKQIGNATYSRHVWGGAADIFIDTTGDGRMDDLNGDGKVDLADARLLHDIANHLFGRPVYRGLTGGLGLYGPRSHRGPFVHIDARGKPAYWSLP